MPKYKFPDPADYGQKYPAVLCPGDRVLSLYNEAPENRKPENHKPAERIAKAVKLWFTKAAHERGWEGVRFLPYVQTMHSAGAVLWQASRIEVQITQTTLVLVEGDDDAGET